MCLRLSAALPLAILFVAGTPTLPQFTECCSAGSLFTPTAAHAKTPLRDLIARLRGQKLPSTIVETNGRIEAIQVDVSAKYPGRLTDVSVDEGSNVKIGQVIGRISSPEYEAQLKKAQSEVDRAGQSEKQAEADMASRQAALEYAKDQLARGSDLVKTNVISKQDFDQRQRNFDAADAAVNAMTAQREEAKNAIKTAQAEVERIQSILRDLVLVSPRNGRVQYQLLRTGEMAAAGTPVATILDLTDVYMTIFLPGADATRLKIGGEARIVLDAVPQYVIPATVSFVAADAQFTPKSVETKDEREKLMFRVKLKLDAKVLERFYTKVKTGLRGIGVVRTDAATAWPDALQVKLPQ